MVMLPNTVLTAFAVMDASSVAISQLHELRLADCEYTQVLPVSRCSRLTRSSFAFVEYESRRDADDAYHEMHNKRMGRDDLLKIEVRASEQYLILYCKLTSHVSGLALRHPLAVASTLAAHHVVKVALKVAPSAVPSVRHVVALAHHLHVAPATTMTERGTSTASETTSVEESVAVSAVSVARESAHAAQQIVTVT